MKRGGLFFAAFLLISGMLRLTSPGASQPAPQEKQAPQKTNKRAPQKDIPKIPYLEKFAAKIEQFYGLDAVQADKETNLDPEFKAIRDSSQFSNGGTVQFVIAILPDPVHTRLGLFFDRSAEALQQAAQMQHYEFDRAIMPWDRVPPPEASDSKNRQEEREEQAKRESFPGLMIFRPSETRQSTASQTDDSKKTQATNSSSTTNSTPARGPLFVLVVGETPTAGLNKQQFRNALKIMRALRGAPGSPPSAADQPLLILGPSFSGSLESLSAELNQVEAREFPEGRFIYSGTVTGTASISSFQEQLDLQLADQRKQQPGVSSYFASFEENDDYARGQFLEFACSRGYQPYEVAILSEDGTVFGASGEKNSSPHPSLHTDAANPKKPCPKQPDAPQSPLDQDVVKLHFPREISYFRSAYQKETASSASPASNSSPVSILPLNLDETGSDDDTVAPYAVPQTSLSQEAVMLGVVSELQKHRIKFTLLLASDPLDELFLAMYLRKAYAQGRVIVTAPDLLLAREGDPALGGVLGLSAYALIPGLSDRLCRQYQMPPRHEDRLFVSSLSAGTFNAMAGLLAIQTEMQNGWLPVSGSAGTVPYAPYAEYGSPYLVEEDLSSPGHCQERPLLWLTILGRDGFWPIAGLNDRSLRSADGQISIASLDSDGKSSSTLRIAADSPKIPQSYGLISLNDSWETSLQTPPAWNIAYCLCLLLLIIHVVFSWTGSILADSEDLAQFARNSDPRGVIILALGAFTLASAFLLVLCTRSPRVDDWVGFPGFSLLLWLPYLVFVGVTLLDLYKMRGQPAIALLFGLAVSIMTAFQVYLTLTDSPTWRIFWSTRLLHITSGVSPVLPVLLLMAAGYWWMWMSLRGVCLVDLRRPRLPEKKDLRGESFRISDTEGEDLRKTAHPFYFTPQIVLPVLGVAAVILVALCRDLPVRSVEGKAFERGFTFIFGLMIAAFLGCLVKLVLTWQKCHQVLAGLDRLPLRAAFGRMKDLTWHSFWNPGGSSLRETYKVMIRALENLPRLDALLESRKTPVSATGKNDARHQIKKTLHTLELLVKTYGHIVANPAESVDPSNFWKKQQDMGWLAKDLAKGRLLRLLMKHVEVLQKRMANTAAVILNEVLIPAWENDESPVVSSGDQIEKKTLSAYRAMAEEFVALIYVNFLVSVLLRIRSMVISAGGIYVFLVLSLNVYPFEPHPALQTLVVVLLLGMGGAVGIVYAEMHRETILSKLTSTDPGELGMDFWIKFVSAGAIPVFSLLAAQFPGINQFLFSWLEPALQAMK
jgi:hypothetical protein